MSHEIDTAAIHADAKEAVEARASSSRSLNAAASSIQDAANRIANQSIPGAMDTASHSMNQPGPRHRSRKERIAERNRMRKIIKRNGLHIRKKLDLDALLSPEGRKEIDDRVMEKARRLDEEAALRSAEEHSSSEN